MVTSPVNATISRILWNFSSPAQTYLEYFPQLQVQSHRTFQPLFDNQDLQAPVMRARQGVC